MTQAYEQHAPLALYRSAALFGFLKALLAVGLLVWFVGGTFFPVQVFRTFIGTLPMFAILAGCFSLVALEHRLALPVGRLWTAFYVFIAAGGFALCLSYLDYADLPSFPRSEQFVARQAYFLAILPIAIISALLFWRRLYARLFAACKRFFLPLALALIASDWLTAIYLGDEFFAQFNDYNLYLEKGTVWLIFAFLYLARTLSGRGFPFVPLCVLVFYYAGSALLGYGSLFHATTGDILFVVLLTATLLSRHPLLCAQTLVVLTLALAAALVAGTMLPDLFQSDVNAYWRFTGWQSNFRALLETRLLGVGFGTPYLPITMGDLQAAVKTVQLAHEPWTKGASAYDLIYLRAQHNSFVNMFFRTGLVGGLAFLLFNLGLLFAALRTLRSCAPPHRVHIALAIGLFVLGLVEISLHVGLETPRFLLSYALSLSLSLLWASPAPAMPGNFR